MLQSAMRCPFCSSRDTRVLDKRDAEDVAMTRRRRECQQCNGRFTTYERPEISTLMIVKKDGRRQPFNREKLRASIQTACTKRPVNIDTIETAVDRIERRLEESGRVEVESSWLGAQVMNELQEVDEVAYVRFASVYRQFKDVTEFMDELRGLREPDEE